MPIRSEDVERYLAFEHESEPRYQWACHNVTNDQFRTANYTPCTPFEPHDDKPPWNPCRWVLR